MASRGDRGWLSGPEVFGGLLILVGAYLLLSSNGIFPFLDWGRLWPLLLVAIGLIVVLTAVQGGGGRSTVRIERQAERRLEVRLAVFGGRFEVGGGSTGLVEATSWRPDIDAEVRRRPSEALVRLRQDHPFRGFSGRGGEWRVALPSDLPVGLRLSAGAGEFGLDLASVQLSGANVSIGAGHLELALPRPSGEVEVRISAGASGIDLRLPAGAESRVSATGLTSVHGVGQTPGYATARDRLTILVSGGATSVNVG